MKVSLTATVHLDSVVLSESGNRTPDCERVEKGRPSRRRENSEESKGQPVRGEARPHHGHVSQASHPHSSLHCQPRRNRLQNQTLGAYRCSSMCIIPSQIIIPCIFTLHLTFQSVLITYIISSPVCQAGTSLVNRDPVTS